MAADVVLVTGACGHIGRELCRVLGESGHGVVAADVSGDGRREFVRCDVRRPDQVARLFDSRAVHTVVHLAGVLPTAFRADPLHGADVNLTGSVHLLREAARHAAARFIFASSMSVYGSSPAPTPRREDDPAAPDEPYGASKRAVELVGEALADAGAIEFVSLRIARVVGPGIRQTSSPWRSQIFEPPSARGAVRVPFGPDALLSLVHVEEVARMFGTLARAERPRWRVYNTPAETWRVAQLREVIEARVGAAVVLADDSAHGGPLCDGTRFTQEFGFRLRGWGDRIASPSSRGGP